MSSELEYASLEGWLLKKKSKDKSAMFFSDNKRWFKVRELKGIDHRELALCYFKSPKDEEARGWLYIKEITAIQENAKSITLVTLAKEMTVEALTRAEHRVWLQGFVDLCPFADVSGVKSSVSLEKRNSLLESKGTTPEVRPRNQLPQQQSPPAEAKLDAERDNRRPLQHQGSREFDVRSEGSRERDSFRERDLERESSDHSRGISRERDWDRNRERERHREEERGSEPRERERERPDSKERDRDRDDHRLEFRSSSSGAMSHRLNGHIRAGLGGSGHGSDSEPSPTEEGFERRGPPPRGDSGIGVGVAEAGRGRRDRDLDEQRDVGVDRRPPLRTGSRSPIDDGSPPSSPPPISSTPPPSDPSPPTIAPGRTERERVREPSRRPPEPQRLSAEEALALAQQQQREKEKLLITESKPLPQSRFDSDDEEQESVDFKAERMKYQGETISGPSKPSGPRPPSGPPPPLGLPPGRSSPSPPLGPAPSSVPAPRRPDAGVGMDVNFATEDWDDEKDGQGPAPDNLRTGKFVGKISPHSRPAGQAEVARDANWLEEDFDS